MSVSNGMQMVHHIRIVLKIFSEKGEEAFVIASMAAMEAKVSSRSVIRCSDLDQGRSSSASSLFLCNFNRVASAWLKMMTNHIGKI